MKRPENRVTRAIERDFGVRFGRRIRLGDWGYTDNAVQLDERTLLVVEEESAQKRSCSVVLTLWPYLEENPGLRVILVRVMEMGAENGRGSRQRLSSFVASKLCDELPEWFVCFRLEIDQSDRLHGELDELRRQLQMVGTVGSG